MSQRNQALYSFVLMLLNDEIESAIPFKTISGVASDRFPTIRAEIQLIPSASYLMQILRDDPTSLTSQKQLTILASIYLEHIIELNLLRQNEKQLYQHYIRKLLNKYLKKEEAISEEKRDVIKRIIAQQLDVSFEMLMRQLEDYHEEILKKIEEARQEESSILSELAFLQNDEDELHDDMARISDEQNSAVASINAFDRGYFISTLNKILPQIPSHTKDDIQLQIKKLEGIHDYLEQCQVEGSRSDKLSFSERMNIRKQRREIKQDILKILNQHVSHLDHKHQSLLLELCKETAAKALDYDRCLARVRNERVVCMNRLNGVESRRELLKIRLDACKCKIRHYEKEIASIASMRAHQKISNHDALSVQRNLDRKMREVKDDRRQMQYHLLSLANKGASSKSDFAATLIDDSLQDQNPIDYIYLNEIRHDLEKMLEIPGNSKQALMYQIDLNHGHAFHDHNQTMSSLEVKCNVQSKNKQMTNHKPS